MEVFEVVRLSQWFSEHTPNARQNYKSLIKILENNATKQSQQPFTDDLRRLKNSLNKMPTKELSLLQYRVLENLRVAGLIGRAGSEWADSTIRDVSYDRATLLQSFQTAFNNLESAAASLSNFEQSAAGVGFKELELNEDDASYIVNIIFKDDASIRNVVEWKNTAKDWDLIIGSVAGLVNERTEEVRVVGASNGSIVLTLAATYSVVKLLAMISKNIASIANDYLDFRIKLNELEQSKFMTATMKEEMIKQEESLRIESKDAILEEVKEAVPDADPEALNMFNRGLDNFIDFGEKGGGMDFVSPPELDENHEDYDPHIAQQFEEVRNLIMDYQAEAQRAKLLTDQRDQGDNDQESEE